MVSHRARRLLFIFLPVAALLALIVAVRIAAPPMVSRMLTAALDRQGLGPAQIDVGWQGIAGLHVGALQLAGGALSLDGADLSLSLHSLLAGRLDQVRLSGLSLAATLDAQGHVAIAGLPSASGSDGAAPSLPLEHLRLDNARVAATTPYGVVAVQLDGTISSGAAGFSADSDLAVTWGTTRLTLPELRIAPRADQGWRITLAHAEAALPDWGLALREIDAELDWSGTALTLHATAGETSDTRKPARFLPMTSELTAERQGSRIDFTLKSADPRSRVVLTAKGTHDTGSGRGTAQVALTTPPFHAGSLQPRDLSPAFGAGLPPIEGVLSIAGPVAWTAQGIAPRLVVSIKDLAATVGAVAISGGHGTLLIDGLAPPSTPAAQSFSAIVELGAAQRLPLDIRLQLRHDGKVAIESATLGLAEGTLATGDLLVDSASGLPRDFALPVRISAVDLSALLKLIDIDGLSGEGRLNGLLPLHIDLAQTGAKRVALQQGKLDGQGAGVVRYTGSGLPDGSGDSVGAQSVALLRTALQDFHYDSLSADLDRSPEGEGGIVLHLSGSNPAVLGGRRFNLNIRLDANFDRLADIFLAGLDAAEGLTRNSVVPAR